MYGVRVGLRVGGSEQDGAEVLRWQSPFKETTDGREAEDLEINGGNVIFRPMWAFRKSEQSYSTVPIGHQCFIALAALLNITPKPNTWSQPVHRIEIGA